MKGDGQFIFLQNAFEEILLTDLFVFWEKLPKELLLQKDHNIYGCSIASLVGPNGGLVVRPGKTDAALAGPWWLHAD